MSLYISVILLKIKKLIKTKTETFSTSHYCVFLVLEDRKQECVADCLAFSETVDDRMLWPHHKSKIAAGS